MPPWDINRCLTHILSYGPKLFLLLYIFNLIQTLKFFKQIHVECFTESGKGACGNLAEGSQSHESIIKDTVFVCLTCCAAQEGVSGGFHGCPRQRRWGVCDRQRPGSQCGRWARPVGWARSGLSPLRSGAFLTTPPPWQSRGRWTTGANKCSPCHAGQGCQSPAEEQRVQYVCCKLYFFVCHCIH